MSTKPNRTFEKIEPLRQQIEPLRQAHEKSKAALADNQRKLADAIAERNELQQAGPPDEELVRKLSEAHIRAELFTNHQTKLEAGAAEILRQAQGVTRCLSRELRKIGVEGESKARAHFIQSIGKLAANSPIEITQAVSGPFVVLQSREEVICRALNLGAQYSQSDGDPFAAFDRLVETFEEFDEAVAQAQFAKAAPAIA